MIIFIRIGIIAEKSTLPAPTTQSIASPVKTGTRSVEATLKTALIKAITKYFILGLTKLNIRLIRFFFLLPLIKLDSPPFQAHLL